MYFFPLYTQVFRFGFVWSIWSPFPNFVPCKHMSKISVYHSGSLPEEQTYNDLIDFLHEQLEQYGDPRHDIQACVDFALKRSPSFGGFITLTADDEGITGVCVVNNTGMKGYIPEHILVYIATHRRVRGTGVGTLIMNSVIQQAEGDIALHVEPDNPARKLYEKLGFTNKYLEMRRVKTA